MEIWNLIVKSNTFNFILLVGVFVYIIKKFDLSNKIDTSINKIKETIDNSSFELENSKKELKEEVKQKKKQA